MTIAIGVGTAPGYRQATIDAILRNVHDAVFATDPEGRITYWGPAAARMFEYTTDQAVGGRFRDLLPSQIDAPSSAEDFDATVAAGRTWRGQGSVTCPSSRALWLESTVTPIRVDGGVVGSVSVSRDMTAEHAAVQALANRVRLLQALAEYTAVANAIHDESRLAPALIDAIRHVIPASHIVLTVLDMATGRYMVRAAYGVDGVVGTEVLPSEGSTGRAIAARTLVVAERLEAEQVGPALRGHLGNLPLTTVAVPLLHAGIVVGAITVARPCGPDTGFNPAEREALALFADHAALAIANARLLAEVSELAVHDGLTGLYNRRHFDASLELMLARWRREGDLSQPISAIMFDLDRFGKLNRDHGHQAGDAVLRAFGGILHERLRSSDLVARYGGEEFVAVLEGTPLGGAMALAELIRAALETRRIAGPDGIEVTATVSAGVALLDPAEATADSLVRAADVGLFMAKRAGRNRVVAA